MYKINKATENLIKSFESLHDGDLSTIGLQPKMDPVGIWTEGYGRAMIDPATKKHLRGAANRKKALGLSTIKTKEEAEAALVVDAFRLGVVPARMILGVNFDSLTDNQKGALVSFVYNCGTGSPRYKIFSNIRLWQAGKLSEEGLRKYWANSIIKATVGGVRKILPGLVRRRKAEADLFFTK